MKKTILTLMILAALLLSLAACGTPRMDGPEAPAAEPQVTAEAQEPEKEEEQPAPADASEPGDEPAEAVEEQEEPAVTTAPVLDVRREDGERFDAVIVLEGMEETVHYEHIRRADLGFEMDYDYESFVRYSDEDGERFVSVWDDQSNPENYLEIRSSSDSAELVTDAVTASLSNDYDLLQTTRELDCAGACTHIEASVIKGTNRMADQLQAVSIIPAPDGCRVATEHSFVVESEGFFRRFAYMLNTMTVFERAE